jgi:cation diffusion facilitator family transporter
MQTHPAYTGIRTTIVGLFVNAVLALTKGVAGFLGNSYALIADAIESASDVVSSLIVVGGLRIAAKPRDENHPYGHGKAEPIAALIVALSLIGAALTIIFQSLHEIITPHHAPASFTLVVLIIVVIAKELLFRFVFRVAVTVQSTAVKTDAWHHRSDAITSLAAFIGITIALLGGPGYESADDWAALFASVIIMYNAYRLFRPALDEIMDAVPPPDIEQQVRTVALSVSGVLALDKCYVRKMGLDYFVDLHVVVDGNLTVRAGHRIGHEVKDSICKAQPRIVDVLIHIEPESFE